MLFRSSRCTPSCPKTLTLGALVLLPSVLLGCADARSSRARGPDDQANWLKITCRQHHRNCLDEAAQRCPTGFEVAQNQGRYDAGADVSFYSGYMLVRCKAPAAITPG